MEEMSYLFLLTFFTGAHFHLGGVLFVLFENIGEPIFYFPHP